MLSQFFQLEPIQPSLLVLSSYDPTKVFVSVMLAVMASVMALQVAGVARRTRVGWQRQWALLSGAVALGGGIWAMHFVGMLAFELCASVSYDPWITGWSVLPALLASTIALNILAREQVRPTELGLAGLLMGSGIGGMHYFGMQAMTMAPLLRYDPLGFLLSLLTAVGLATLALWVRFGMQSLLPRHGWVNTWLAGAIMGSAISLMHYMGMAAATFVGAAESATPLTASSANQLTIAITIATIALSVMVLSVNAFLIFRETIQRRVQEAESRISSILESAAEGILGVNRQGRITFANRAAQQILGYSTEELTQVSHHPLILRHPTERNQPEAQGFLVEDTLGHGLIWHADDAVFQHQRGHQLDVEYTCAPIRDEGDSISGAVIVFRDVTQRKQTENALKSANAELEEFAYRTSHDLRSPLVSAREVIRLVGELLDSGETAEAKDCLEMASSALTRLDTLVRDILELTRTKNVDEEVVSVDVAELVATSIEKISHMPHFNRVDLQTQIELPGPVMAKRSRLTLIVENLLSNAIKYQDLNNPSPFVRVSAQVKNQRLQLQVEDNGLGIPEKNQAQLFQMFKRFHTVSFGSGLGLYMMKKSADILGGDIRFADRKPGAQFSFEMPLH